MAKIPDAEAHATYVRTLALWRYRGYVLWKPVAADWVRTELRGVTCEEIHALMHAAASADPNSVRQKVEKRPEYTVFRFFYEIILPINGRRIYVESILVDDDPVDMTIRVVSCHDAN